MTSLPLAAPALPLDEAGKYVAGAYIVFVALLLIYVGIMAIKLSRIQNGLEDLADYAEKRNRAEAESKAEAAPEAVAETAGR